MVRPGDLFFTLGGGGANATAEAAEAVRRGAAAVITENSLPLEGVPQYLVPDARLALAEFCQSLVGRPSRETQLIGVLGPEAFSPLPRLASAAIAAGGGQPAWWDGRWACDSASLPIDSGTTATPPLVASWLSRAVAEGSTHAVASIGRRSLADRAFAACRFGVVCLRGLGRGPTAGGSAQDTRDLVAGLVSQLGPTGVLVADADDADACRAAVESPHRLLTFGLGRPADVSGEVVERHTGGQTLLACWGEESIALQTPVLGDDHAADCLAAVAIGLACGADLRAAVRGVERAPRPPGVLEPVVVGQDFQVYLDAGLRAGRVRAAATAAAQQSTTGRLITVVCGPAEAGLLTAAARQSELVIVGSEGGSDGGSEGSSMGATDGLSDFATRPEFRFVEDPFAAVALGVALAETGDAVLVTGVGLDADGQCKQRDEVRELIALRNANTPPASRAA